MDRFLGKLLDDRYEITEKIGEGGMALVYKAWDENSEDFVAVKILKEEYAGIYKFRKKFQDESRAIAMLQHKNIVDVVDVSFKGDYSYIVMEYIKGHTLEEFIEKKAPFPVSIALRFANQILSGLRHAHEKGVIHRDIKPQNIMVLKDGNVKVTDFGIASFANYNTVKFGDKAVGSVHYISPEQAKDIAVDHRTDLYSLGIILYEMLTGTVPFDGDSPISVALKQVKETPVLPSKLNPKIPKGLEQIIMHALEKDPDDRYKNAKEMQKDLSEFMSDETTVFPYDLPEDVGESIEKKPTKIIPTVKDDGKNAQKKKQKRGIVGIKNVLVKNRLIAMLIGGGIAFVLVIVALFGMYATVNSFNSRLVSVPDLVGRSVEEVKKDVAVTSNFKIVEQSPQYDSLVEAGYIISQDPTTGTYESGKEIKVTVSLGVKQVIIPYLVKKSQNIAVMELKQADLKAEVITEKNSEVPAGCVIKTDPISDTPVAAGSTVKVYVSVETESGNLVKVPNVEGKSESTATAELKKRGLKVSVKKESSDSVPEGRVISQSIDGLSEVDKNSEIVITVSSGSSPKSGE